MKVLIIGAGAGGAAAVAELTKAGHQVTLLGIDRRKRLHRSKPSVACGTKACWDPGPLSHG